MRHMSATLLFAACLAGALPAAAQLQNQSRLLEQPRLASGDFLLATVEAVPPVMTASVVPQDTGDQEKNPWLAFGLSTVLTGAGQVYNEEIEKGVIMFAGGVAGYVILYSGDSPGAGRAWTGWGLFVVTKVWSMVDAPMVSNRINEEARASSLQLIPVVTPGFAGARLAYQF